MVDNFEIRSPASEKEWETYDSFRWEVLRKPLKMSHIPLKDNLEEVSIHLMGVTSEGKVLACGRLHLNTSEEAQIRYMAVDEAFRAQGIGKEVLKERKVKFKVSLQFVGLPLMTFQYLFRDTLL